MIQRNLKNKVIIILSTLIVTAFCTCSPHPTPFPPDIQTCEEACNHIGPDGLNCEEGQPIDMLWPDAHGCVNGIDEVKCVSCKKFCEDTMNQRVWLEPSCVLTINSCDQIESCAPVGNVD